MTLIASEGGSVTSNGRYWWNSKQPKPGLNCGISALKYSFTYLEPFTGKARSFKALVQGAPARDS